jgi:hypothetical protein
MGDILVGTNNRRLALVPRSGSHSIVVAWMQHYEPEEYNEWFESGSQSHPANFLRQQEVSEPRRAYSALGVVVRNPVARFCSMIAHRNLAIEQQLQLPLYPPIQPLSYTHFFRFENQLQECAEWLGIAPPIPVLAESDEDNKPNLTPEQEARVRELFADDIALWESL